MTSRILSHLGSGSAEDSPQRTTEVGPDLPGRKLSAEELAALRTFADGFQRAHGTREGHGLLLDHISALQAERDAANEKFLDLAEMAGLLKRQRDELVEATRVLIDCANDTVASEDGLLDFLSDAADVAAARLTGERP